MSYFCNNKTILYWLKNRVYLSTIVIRNWAVGNGRPCIIYLFINIEATEIWLEVDKGINAKRCGIMAGSEYRTSTGASGCEKSVRRQQRQASTYLELKQNNIIFEIETE